MVEHLHHRAENQLAELVQELLDAHADTVCLTEPTAASLHWVAHVEYLRGLQRVGKERLAELCG
jgi:hypothetical protein